ncbi:trichodiene oxygenase [Ilyonectria robusta]
MPDSIVTGVQPLLVLYFALALVVVYIFGQGLYNLYLHALGTIPGPKLAAFSRLYEFWFDVIQDGQYLWEIGRMHNKYGNLSINAHEPVTSWR